MSFILLDGSFFNGEFSVFALSGVMFLGIGDAIAALFGKRFGSALWGKFTSKSQEGTIALVICTSAVYYVLVGYIHARTQEHFMIVIMSTILTGGLEGMTL